MGRGKAMIGDHNNDCLRIVATLSLDQFSNHPVEGFDRCVALQTKWPSEMLIVIQGYQVKGHEPGLLVPDERDRGLRQLFVESSSRIENIEGANLFFKGLQIAVRAREGLYQIA